MSVAPLAQLPQIGPSAAYQAQLRELFKQALALGKTSRQDAAEWMAEQLSPEQCRQALVLCLPGFIGQLERVDIRKEGANKAERIQSWYAKQLDTTVFVKDEPKFFGECTVTDLQEIAKFRYAQARRLASEADTMLLIAKYMREHDKQRVGNLNEGELRQLMGVAQ